jgi:hypothetical protein
MNARQVNYEPSSPSAGCALVAGVPRVEYMRSYRLKNRIKLTAQRKAWMTHEKEAEYNRRYAAQKLQRKRKYYRERQEVCEAVKGRVKKWIAAHPDKRRDAGIKRDLAKRLQCKPSDIPQDFITLNRAHLNLKAELAKLQ